MRRTHTWTFACSLSIPLYSLAVQQQPRWLLCMTWMIHNVCYIYMPIHTHAYTYTCLYIHMPIHTHAYTYTCLYIYMPIHTHAYTYTCLYINMPIHIHAYTYTCLYIHMPIHTHAYMQAEQASYDYIHTQSYSYNKAFFGINISFLRMMIVLVVELVVCLSFFQTEPMLGTGFNYAPVVQHEDT